MFKFICRFVWASANCHMFSPCPSSIENNSRFKYSKVIYLCIYIYAGCWFQTFFMFTPEPWGDNPIRQTYFSVGKIPTKTRCIFAPWIRLQAGFFQEAWTEGGGDFFACSKPPQKMVGLVREFTPKRCRKFDVICPQMFWLLKLLDFSHHGRFGPWTLTKTAPGKGIWILYSGLYGCFFLQTTHAHTQIGIIEMRVYWVLLTIALFWHEWCSSWSHDDWSSLEATETVRCFHCAPGGGAIQERRKQAGFCYLSYPVER